MSGDGVDAIEGQPSSSDDAMPAMLEQLETITKELDSMRGDIRSIRVATHRGFQDIERQIQIRQSRKADNSSDGRQIQIRQSRKADNSSDGLSADGVSLEKLGAGGLEFESRLAALRDALKGEMEERYVELESQMNLQGERSSAALQPILLDSEALQARLEALQVDVEREALQNANANAKLDNLQSFLEREALQNTTAYTKLEGLQKDIEREVALREKSEDEVAQRLNSLADILERRNRSEHVESQQQRRDSSTTDCESFDTDVETMWSKEIAVVANQIKDLRLCLEAEVGARSAGTERLDRQMQELQNRVETDKAFKESLQELQSEVEALQESRNRHKEGSSPLRGGVEFEVLKDGLSSLEAQAKKHVVWVETQAEKHASRMEAIETFVKKIQLEIGSQVQASEENLRKYIVTELAGQAKFFEVEIKGLLMSAHENWASETQKLWQAIGSESSGASRDGFKEQQVRLKAAIDSMRQAAEVTEKMNAEEVALSKAGATATVVTKESMRKGSAPQERVEPPPQTSPRKDKLAEPSMPSQPGHLSVPPHIARRHVAPRQSQAAVSGSKSVSALLQTAGSQRWSMPAQNDKGIQPRSPRKESPRAQTRQVAAPPAYANFQTNPSMRKTSSTFLGPSRLTSDPKRPSVSPLRPTRMSVALGQRAPSSVGALGSSVEAPG
eukprot:CAMPEP_0169397294 /NCGR_PEP_ID=MMETSP1017-20121227/51882_1 /TAXON_ID=342587 /ORGANISM="Karlodinium micrum, Strain CCMP2283" /LENGTH=674 /DNA_ID=CAMNT_0009501905 /DNA_START=52 /DNA_END=2077 /DNA_ORIENTATION=+